MFLINFIQALLVATTLAVVITTPTNPARSPNPVKVLTHRDEDPACRPGKPCCNFKLRIYQRCIPQPNNYQGRVETWPLFYNFASASNQPIEPIAGDYNMQVCDGCTGPEIFGNITGPNNLFLRWSWFEEPRGGSNIHWDILTYWTHNPDGHFYENHRDRATCNFAEGEWSEYDEDHRKWGDACRFKGSNWFNRTRVCGLRFEHRDFC